MSVSVTPELVAGALTNFRSIFSNRFDQAIAQQAWPRIAMPVESNSDKETHVWLGTPPQMVDVTHDTLQVEGLYANDYSIQNLTWKSAVEVPRPFFEDEKLNLVTPRIRQLAARAAAHPGKLIFQLVVNNPLAFDGVALIADTRTIGRSANIDNQIAGGSDPTVVANFQAQLAAATAQMMLFQDDQGEPMGNIGNVIMLPAALRQVAYQALNAQQTPGSIATVAPPDQVVGSPDGYQIIVNPYLTDTNDWYLLNVRDGAAPFIYQTRIAPGFEDLGPGSLPAILNDKFIFTVRARYNTGVADPRDIVKTTNT